MAEANPVGRALVLDPHNPTEKEKEDAIRLGKELGGVFAWIAEGFLIYDPVRGFWILSLPGLASRRLSDDIVRRQILVGLRRMEQRLKRSTRNVAAGRETIGHWQRKMNKLLIAGHILFGMVGAGAASRLRSEMLDIVRRQINKEVQYLNKYAAVYAGGAIKTVRKMVDRARRYGAGFHTTFWRVHQEYQKGTGKSEARRYLRKAEHCRDCPPLARLKWMPIDEMPPIGTVTCRNYCRCYIEYR